MEPAMRIFFQWYTGPLGEAAGQAVAEDDVRHAPASWWTPSEAAAIFCDATPRSGCCPLLLHPGPGPGQRSEDEPERDRHPAADRGLAPGISATTRAWHYQKQYLAELERLARKYPGRRRAGVRPEDGCPKVARSRKPATAANPTLNAEEVFRMSLKEHEYIRQTLERYTNCPLEEFCDHILITNFRRYLMRFQEKTKGEFSEGNFRIVNAKDINCTMIDFGIGSPQAALVINCLAYLDNLKSVIMLGMCGGIDDILKTGDFLVPSAAIRGEGTSRHYLPPEFPAIPASSVNLVLHRRRAQARLHAPLRHRLHHRPPVVGVRRGVRRAISAGGGSWPSKWSSPPSSPSPTATKSRSAPSCWSPTCRCSDAASRTRSCPTKFIPSYMDTHLDIGIDAVAKLSANWNKVSRKLTSEW